MGNVRVQRKATNRIRTIHPNTALLYRERMDIIIINEAEVYKEFG